MLSDKDKPQSRVVDKKKSDCTSAINEIAEFEDTQEIAAFKSAKDGIIIGDLWGYISDVNEAIVKMYGATDKSEFIGKHVLEFLVKEERRQAVQDSLDSIMTNKGKTQKYRALSKSGEMLSIEVTTTFMKDKQGERIGFIDIVRKIPGRNKK